MAMELSARQARIIASWWHSGQTSGLCALATSGVIVEGVDHEIETEMRLCETPDQKAQLEALLGFVTEFGERGRVPGWAQLDWSSADEDALERWFKDMVSGR